MFRAHCITVHDPFHPSLHREIRELNGPAPLSALAPTTNKPFVIIRNGEAVLRADWGQVVKSGDLVAVAYLPQGDDGSDVGQIIGMIIVAIVAYYTGVYVGAEWGATAGYVAQTAVGLVGSALVNAMGPQPGAQGTDSASGMQASPTYNISAQGNQARLEAAIPEQYGRMLCFPDFAASPYVEYSGNEQYLYQLFCIGRGDYEIEKIQIEDTDVSNFDEVTYEIVRPGETLDLFPAAVATSIEVSGQEMLTSTEIGPFVANSAGTVTTKLGVDVVWPRGLFYASDEGGIFAKSTSWTVSARLIDDEGDPLGSWVDIGTHTVTKATSTPQRETYYYTVAAGRYEVKVVRTDVKDTSNRAGHEIAWAGLRAYLVDDADYGDVTLLAMRMRATNNLSAQASRKVNVLCTRKLYYWTGAAWAGPVATRSIAWALYDCCSKVGLPDSRIDLDALVALNDTWTARGDTFDGRFDSTQTFWEALRQIGLAGRVKPYMQGGVVCFRRDEAVSLPVALYSMRNIVRGSFSLEFLTPSNDTADAVEVTYFDGSTWKPRRLMCALPGSSSSKPAKVQFFGITNREQAYREGIYQAAANRYRRTLIKFTTEMEGFIPSYGDLVAISHDLPQWGQHAEVVAWDDANLKLTLSEPMVFDAGAHYIGLRARDGSVVGPIAVTAGDTAFELVLETAPSFTPYTGQSEERTHVVFGWGETWRQLARVISVKPRDEYTVELICINEDPSVHTADLGITAPPINSSQLPATPAAPQIIGLSARSMPDNEAVMILSWQPAPGAEYYLIEQSADGESWTRSGETRAANYTTVALYGSQTIIRVAAVGSIRGSWAAVNFSLLSDRMWATDPDTLMWSADTNLMWR